MTTRTSISPDCDPSNSAINLSQVPTVNTQHSDNLDAQGNSGT